MRVKASVILTLSLVATGCISQDGRQSRDTAVADLPDTAPADAVSEVVEPDTAATDSADAVDVRDTLEPVDTPDVSLQQDSLDTSDPAEILDGDTNEVVRHECLPPGCSAVLSGCEVLPGWCFIAGVCHGAGAADPGNACRECNPATPTVFSGAALGKDCDDGVTCTSNDLCIDGECAGSSNCPASQLVCASTACSTSTGQCELTVDSGHCVFADTCFLRSNTDALACQHCDPDIDQFALVPGDGDEPTSSFVESVSLGIASDTDFDTWSQPEKYATLSPASDRDFYAFNYYTSVSFYRPAVKVTPEVDAPGLTFEVCIFVTCSVDPDFGTADVTTLCLDGSNKVTEGGKVGCCKSAEASRVAAFELTPDRVFCSRDGVVVQSRADAFVTVRRTLPPVAPSCLGYTIQHGVRMVIAP